MRNVFNTRQYEVNSSNSFNYRGYKYFLSTSSSSYQALIAYFTQNYYENLINHGTNYSNWMIDPFLSSKTSSGMYLVNTGTFEYIRYLVSGLPDNTDYWMKVTIPWKGASAGNLRVLSPATDGSNFNPSGGVDVNIGGVGTSAPTGTYFVRMRTTVSSTGHLLCFRHASSLGNGAGNELLIGDVQLLPIPTRSSAKVAIMGDRTASHDAGNATLVSTGILAATGDNYNVVSPGDLSDGTYALAATNNTLKNILISRGGDMYATPGNWDYTASISTWTGYFGLNKTYHKKTLGEIDFFFYDNNSGHADNDQTTVPRAQASVMGQWLITGLAASTAKWKVVIMHFPAVSSSTHHGGPSTNAGWIDSYKCMRWNWSGLDVPLVIQSHDHVVERMVISGTAYYTFALGGGGPNAFGTPIPESQYRSLIPGYLKLHDSTTGLIIEHMDTGNMILDRHRIHRYEA